MDKYIHAFWQIPETSYVSLYKINAFFDGNFDYAWCKASQKELMRAGLSEIYINKVLKYRKKLDIEAAILNLLKENIVIIGRNSPEMPAELLDIEFPPFLIYRRGTDLRDLSPRIAIVGTRKSSVWGEKTSYRLAAMLTDVGVTVVSGLAFGIDASAHSGSLHGKGKTIAILASGINHVTPSSHNSLSKKILESGGTLLSEYPNTSSAFKYRFLERNRLISALSSAVVVVEAAKKSGALITAEHAVVQNKLLLAFPGAPGNLLAAGCNTIIKNGARLVDSIGEILNILREAYIIPEEQTTISL